MATTTLDREPSALDRPLWSALALNWEKALYLALIAAAFITRFYDLGARVMSHDESLHTQWSWYLFQGRGFEHSPLMHGPLKFEVTAFVYWLLGDNDFTSRLPSALMGVAAVGLMYYFRRWLGRSGALVSAGLMLISPYMLYYARYIRDEPYVVVWGLLLALCVIRYMETRQARFLYGLTIVSALFYATMETSFIYIAIHMLFLGFYLVWQLFVAAWPRPEFRRPFELAFLVTLVALLVSAGFLLYGRQAGVLSATETAIPANPEEALTAGAAAASPFTQVAAIAGVVAAAGLLSGVYLVFRAFGSEMRRFAALDVLIVFGVFVLPQLTAFPVRALGHNPINYTLPPMEGLSFGDRLLVFLGSDAGVSVTICFILLAVSAAVGWVWDRRKFLISSGIFYGIYITLFTTFFTNGGGLATGIIGSLGYWLEQQGVRRGNQPWYYYPVVNLTVYEFLPALGALFALGLWLARPWSADPNRRARADVSGPAKASAAEAPQFPAIGLFGFWSVMALIGFSIAGEKMPWLTTHITLPLILVSGWAIGRFIDGTDWQMFRARRAWLAALVLPVTVVAVVSALGGLLGANPPFQGSTLPQLQATGAFVSAVIVAVIGGIVLRRLGGDLGWRNVARLAVLSVFGLLALLTARAAFVAAYINYDYANEYLVYAHGARGVKTIMEQIEDISVRTTDGLDLRVYYDQEVSWPVTWYLRHYRNAAFYSGTPTREGVNVPVVIASAKTWDRAEALLGNRYYQFEYIRMVWPMQEYFNLNSERVRNALTSRDYRQALWNIWFARDYTLYGQLTNTNYDLSQWPVADRMRLYVRKDVAAQIWNYGVGPSVLSGPGPEEDPYLQSRQVIAAARAWGAQGTAPGAFDAPRAVAVAPDGALYVADSRNHRIQKFDADGNLLLTWGSFGSLEAGTADPGNFNEPWGVGVGPDGSVYVADTWNHRIQKFDANGNFVTAWGNFGQAETFNTFWGPRAVAVDASGRVFVADTGNKRVVVFDGDGRPLMTIGSVGFESGFFDEPVGVALDADGALYVADTWNQRVQVFRPDPEIGEYLFSHEWPIAGWYGQSLDNKPYLALDGRGRVYVTDPEGYRVLVFDGAGEFLTTWGDFGADSTAFGLVSGVAVDAAGNVYVSDGGNHRLMKFPPLP
jgi:uncharacterized protein (TIGR03663 family)